jgi:hypothetical protein
MVHNEIFVASSTGKDKAHEQRCESRMFIHPDPNFSHPRSMVKKISPIPDPDPHPQKRI